MIAVLKQLTFGGDTVYAGYIQVDEHQGIPVLATAVGKGGLSRSTIKAAIQDAKAGRRRAKSQRRFQRLDTTVAVIRSQLADRVVYSGILKVRVSAGVTVYEPVLRPGFWPESIDEAIASIKAVP